TYNLPLKLAQFCSDLLEISARNCRSVDLYKYVKIMKIGCQTPKLSNRLGKVAVTPSILL
ncbi:hypothetical protein, partial [Xanthomonas citri]|uniref:hypothetical protein n=1 Tax=Xanthomonas citri TaxID=346 RepID=UPI001E36B2CE